MIVGVGIELVDTARFEAAIDRFGDRLRERLFTTAERDYSPGSTSQRVARTAGADSIALTLTHDAQWCVGQVILESSD